MPSLVAMPSDVKYSLKDAVFPLEVALRVFESKTKIICDPQIALTSSWNNEKYNCRILIVRSSQGDFLRIERFLQDNKTAPDT